jgi:hypothetical protein
VKLGRPGDAEAGRRPSRYARGPNSAQRGAQPQAQPACRTDSPTGLAWCPICRRHEPIVRCEDCGTDLHNPHALVRIWNYCKAIRRVARNEPTGSQPNESTP